MLIPRALIALWAVGLAACSPTTTSTVLVEGTLPPEPMTTTTAPPLPSGFVVLPEGGTVSDLAAGSAGHLLVAVMTGKGGAPAFAYSREGVIVATFESTADQGAAEGLIAESHSGDALVVDRARSDLRRYGPSGNLLQTHDEAEAEELELGDIRSLTITTGSHNALIYAKETGKALTVGQICGSPDNELLCDIAVARFDETGLLDGTFGPDATGLVEIDVVGGEDGAFDVVALAGGAVLLAGYACHHSVSRDDCDIAVIRLTENGHVDQTFGKGGTTLIDIDRETFESALGLEVLSDGSIIVGARTGTGGVVIKLSEAGTVDNSFGDSGVVAVWDDSSVRIDVAELENGDIVAVGETFEWLATARFDGDGSATELGDGVGALLHPWPSQCHDGVPPVRPLTTSVVVTPSGRTIIGSGHCLVAIDATGRLDDQFGA